MFWNKKGIRKKREEEDRTNAVSFHFGFTLDEQQSRCAEVTGTLPPPPPHLLTVHPDMKQAVARQQHLVTALACFHPQNWVIKGSSANKKEEV